MAQPFRYTQFPNLYDTVEAKQAQVTAHSRWPVSLPQELLILSWAKLLQSYTAVTNPVFSFGGIAIQVNVQLGSWIAAEIGDEDFDGRVDQRTSLNLDKLSKPATFALELQYDSCSGSIALSSACCAPESFLLEILSQLQHIVIKGAKPGYVFSASRAPLLSIVNPSRETLPGPNFLQELVHPPSSSKVAIDFLSAKKQRKQLSYQDLDQLSDRLATRVTSALATCHDPYSDVSNGFVVPVLISQSPELYISQIAVLKSGAAFCPLNLDIPHERLAFILKDVDAKVVMTTRDCRHRFSDLGLNIFTLVIDEEDRAQALESRVSGTVQKAQTADNLAYVMYTSGSTGLPKGVGVSHRSVTQALLAHDEHVPRYHRFLQFAAPTFDVSVFEIFFTFYRGATLVCCHREDMLGDLTGVMTELRVDAAELTPTVVGTLLRHWDAVPCLKLLLTIGEMLPRSVIEHFAQSVNHGRILLPLYGPTEASIHCTVVPRIGLATKAGIIGRPLSTVSVFVLSEDSNCDPDIMPVGHVGELAVAGQLAQGYINRPEQTSAAFIMIPGYGLVYRTGDRARLLPSGELECLGRIASGQVKIRGQRVELGEVEQIICQVSDVRFAVASVLDGNLIVFCLLDEVRSTSDSRQVIQEKCRAWLPPFMRPTDLVLLTKDLPRLPSGKIDKQSLESLYYRQDRCPRLDEEEYSIELERLVASLIQEELDVKVGRHEDLWSKGLDSLRAIRLASKLRGRSIEVAATDLLSADSIAALSRVLQQRIVSRPAPQASSADKPENASENIKETIRSELDAADFSEVEDVVPCSKLQLAMLSESEKAKHLNLNWMKIEASRPMSVEDFEQAFCRLAQLNCILRSGFIKSPQQDSHFVRIVWKRFDPGGQIRREDPRFEGVCDPREAQNMTLLRPLLLRFITGKNHTTVLIHIHHALYDGWSWDLIMTDLELLIRGMEPPERPQFQQFVQHERDFLASKKAAEAKEYWTDHLRDITPTPLPVLTTTKHKRETRVFNQSLEVKISLLEAASQQIHISRHSIPSAAFATLLSLYCGTPEVVYGSVSSGRTCAISGIENIIGPCISTLPVRINFDNLRTVRDLLSRTHDLHHDFLHFGQLPLRDIKNTAKIGHGQDLFDTLLVWQESLTSKESDASAFSVTDGTDSLHYALILEIEPKHHQLHAKVTYDASVICAEQVEHFVSQFEATVCFYSQSSDAPWKEVLGCIQPKDLSIANSKFSSVDSNVSISSTIDRLAQNDPARTAIEYVDDLDPLSGAIKVSRLSYRALSQRARLVAQFLLCKGVAVDDLVCLFMNKSIPMYISILGVLKAGAAYLVIDPQAPPERVRRILDSARCRYCLTISDFEGHELLSRVDTVLFYDQVVQSSQHKKPLPDVNLVNLAYAVFTSGSTGVPKGVLVTRKNILSNIDFLSRIYPFVTDGALLQGCSPAFDVSVFEILYTWHTGMRLCAASNDVLFRDIEQFIELLGITHLSLTPSVAALISPNNVPSVKMLVTAGEAVTSKVFRDWSGRGLYQGYGPSETTNICSVQREVSPSDHINNIGRPLPNTSMFISASEVFQVLLKGALGEIWIGGEQVGRGYLDDVKLTAEKFIDHEEYGRLYRSGDLGRMLPDGSILFQGRQDDQVKLRGQRIELGEIEQALLAEPAVSDGCCILIEGSNQRPSRLVAYWSSVPSPGTEPKTYTKAIFDRLELQLPAYMVPDFLIHVLGLPLTTQGKCDRKALKQLYLDTEPAVLEECSRQEGPTRDDELIDPNEIKLAQAIMEVTGSPLSIIGRNTSFFALGLDSINCIGLSRRLFELGFKRIDVSMILRHASMAKLITALPATREEESPELTSKLRQIFDEKWQENVRLEYSQKGFRAQKILPCTPLQEAMLSQAEGGSEGAYQNRLTFSVLGDLQRLKAAWTTCVAAHEILRTGFILTKSSQFPFAQVVLADYSFIWDDQHHPGGAGNDLEQLMAPPYSFSVTKKSGTAPPRVILKMHHALYDAQAISLLLHDVQRAYRHYSIEAISSLEPYLGYMVGLDSERANKFWQAHLKSYSPKLMSRPSRNRPLGSSPMALVSRVSMVPLQALVESSKQTSVTVLSLLQLTWARLLSHYSSVPDICFGNVYNGRSLPIPGVEKIAGPCFNTLPVRIMLAKHDTNQQAARRLHDHNLAAIRFQPCSLRSIQSGLGVSRLFDTLLLLQAEPVDLDSSIWTLEEDSGDMKFPLILEVIQHPKRDQLDLALHAEPGLLSLGELEAILANFDLLLEHVLRYPDASASDASILGQEKQSMFAQPVSPTGTTAYLPARIVDEEWSSLEHYISGILCKLSRRSKDELNRATTIYHLGFDSISAIQIAVELRRDGYRLSTGDILEAATVPKIASLCDRHVFDDLEHNVLFDFDAFSKKHLKDICQRYSINQESVEEIRPCTPFQSGILAGFVRSGGNYYLNSIEYELNSDLDLGLLQKAWKCVSRRHDILRTGFAEIDDVLYPFSMVVYSQEKCALPWSEDHVLDQNYDTYAQLVLDSLPDPPWRLVIRNRGIQKIMHLSMLHALFDATVLELLLDEVAATYRGEKLPEVIPTKRCLSRILCKRPPQPADDVSMLSDQDILLSTKLPNLHSHHSSDAGFRTIDYDCSYSLNQLQTRCRKAGATLQVAGQCAWARLLSAYTGEAVSTFGVVLTGRSVEHGESDVFFPCINTVPISVNVKSTTNRTLLAGAAQRNATLVKNPFACSKKSPKSSEEPFDTLFVFQNQRPPQKSSLWKMLTEDARANHTVSVELFTVGYDTLHFRLTFRKQTVPAEQGLLLVKQFDAVLLNTLDRLDDEASNLDGLDSDLLSIVPPKDPLIETEVEYLHQFVESSSQIYPEKGAFEFAESIIGENAVSRSWTYSELDAEGNKVAHLLQQNGAIPGELIGICFDKCPEASFSILGILKAGCGFLALDPNAPEARKKFILVDSGCRILCTTQDKADSLALVEDLRILTMDKLLNQRVLPSHSVDLLRKLHADDVCYCLYTSGTTGMPKGCLITHSNAVQFMLAFQRLFKGQWDADSKFLQFASFHFDVSVMEQYWSWSVGMCVTSAPRDLLFEDLPAAIRALQITHLDLTPSLARLLTPEECPSLCRGAFITGGEQLTQDIIEAWGKEQVIYNGYGPSEVTIGCTMYPRVSKSAKPSNIGLAYDNVGAFVLEAETNHPVLKGAIGELCVSGPLVGKGYLNRADLTAEKFEYIDHLQARIYHTGDLVRLLHDGSFCFIGRADDQVKLRGQRLEIGEINHIVRQTSKMIKEAATMVLRHSEHSKDQLVTFIASSECRTTLEEPAIASRPAVSSLIHRIRRACNDALPSYMVPTYVIPVTVMPLSANNKIDKKALKTLFEAISATQLQKLAAADVSQRSVDQYAMKKVVGAISQLIGISEEAVLPSSSLFELGLDSISAISLSRLLKRAGFGGANSSMIMRNSVVADLTVALTELVPVDDQTEAARHASKQEIEAFERAHKLTVKTLLGISNDALERIAPCTPLQGGMIARSLKSCDATYFSNFTFSLDKAIDINRIQAAWRRVQGENQILRTKFVATVDGYAQVVLKNSATQIVFQQSTIEREGEYQDVLTNDFVHWSKRVRSMENELWAVTIYHTPEQILMTLYIFHGLYDGISLALALEEVACHYNGRPILHPKPSYCDSLSFGPLSCLPGAQDFWTKHLLAIHLLNLPSQNDSKQSFVVSSEVACSDNVKRLRVQLSVTEAAIFQACWLMALEHKFGILPTTGVVVSGRSIDVDGIENVVGPLFNTIPCQIEGSSTLGDLAKECHSFNIDTIPYQHTPLSKISKWLGRRSGEPLFDSLFVYQKEARAFSESSKLWKEVTSTSQPHYPLAFEVEQKVNGHLKCIAVAQSQFLRREELHELLDIFEKGLADMSRDAYRPLEVGKERRPRSQDTAAKKNQSPQAAHSSRRPNRADDSKLDFQWDATSKLMRSEIAKLSASDIADVGPDVSIFELGLDSIDAIKLSTRLKAAGISISLSSILQTGSVAKMAKYTTAEEASAGNESYTSLDQVSGELRRSMKDQGLRIEDYEKILPVTPLQETMLANYEQYFSQEILKITEGVDVEKLKFAWRNAVSTHDTLRTSFMEVDDPRSAFAYAQLVSRDVDFECSSMTLSCETELQTILSSQRAEAGRRGINQIGLRLSIVSIGSTTFLVLGLPHAVYDGWSINLLHQDIASYYEGLQCVRPSYEPLLEHLVGVVPEKSLLFWRDILTGLHPKLFPKRRDKPTANPRTNRHEFSSDVPAAQVIAFCKSAGVTLQSLALTCWALVLAQYLQCRDVCFGVVLAGRDIEHADEMMFPAMNTVPFRLMLRGNRLEMVKDAHNLSIAISEHQHFPLRKTRSMVAAPSGFLFDTLFIYQKRPLQTGQSKPLYESVGGLSDPEYPVNVEMEMLHDEIVWRTAGTSDVLDMQDTQALLRHVDNVLKSIITKPSDPTFVSLPDGISICDLPAFNDWTDKTLLNGTQLTMSKDAQVDEAVLLPNEEVIREVLAEVANVTAEDITSSMSLFQLGLDSISAIKVSSSLKKRSLSLPVSEMLRALTVKKMAEVAEPLMASSDKRLRKHDDNIVPMLDPTLVRESLKRAGIPENQVESVLPCTPGQMFFLGMWQASAGRLFYPEFHYRIQGPSIDRQSIESAWARLLQAATVLRTVFLSAPSTHNSGVQIIMKQPLTPVVWSSGSAQRTEDTNGLSLYCHQPPLMLFATEMHSTILLRLKIHHALYDGVSLPRIMSAFRSFCDSSDAVLELETDFHGYLNHLQNNQLKERQKAFWTSYLGSTSLDSFNNASFEAPRVQIFRPRLIENLSSIEKRLKQNSISLQALFFAAYAIVHSKSVPRPTTSEDMAELTIGVYLANRSDDHRGLSVLLAPTVNIVPLKIPIRPGHSLFDSARSVQDDLGRIGSIEHCTVSLSEIHEWTGVKIDCFVNFLRLPDVGSTPTLVGQVSIGEVEPEDQMQNQMTDQTPPNPFADDVPMQDSGIYLPSIDIEAAIRNNALDVGVFAPADKLDRQAAENLLAELRAVLESCEN